MNTKTLVFGGSGFIGKNLIASSDLSSQEYISISRQNCDLLNIESINNYILNLPQFNYNIIILSTIPKLKILNLSDFRQNISMINNILNSIKNLSVNSIIYFSSVDVYGTRPSLPITEQTNLMPNDYYGASKIINEYSVLNYKLDIPKLILRLPGVYGSKNDKFSIIEKFASSIIKRDEIEVIGKGDQLRDYIYINDINEIIKMYYSYPVSGVFNFVTGNSVSIISIIEKISSILKIKPNIYYNTVKRETDNLIFDNKNILTVFESFKFSEINLGIKKYLKQKLL